MLYLSSRLRIELRLPIHIQHFCAFSLSSTTSSPGIKSYTLLSSLPKSVTLLRVIPIILSDDFESASYTVALSYLIVARIPIRNFEQSLSTDSLTLGSLNFLFKYSSRYFSMSDLFCAYHLSLLAKFIVIIIVGSVPLILKESKDSFDTD